MPRYTCVVSTSLELTVASQIREYFETYIPKKDYHIQIIANGKQIDFIATKVKIGGSIKLTRISTNRDQLLKYELSDKVGSVLKSVGSVFANEYWLEEYNKVISEPIKEK